MAVVGFINLLLLIWTLGPTAPVKLSTTLLNLVRAASTRAEEATKLRTQASAVRTQADQVQKAADRERARAVEAQEEAAAAEVRAEGAQRRAETATAKAQRNERELEALREILANAAARSFDPPANF